MRRRPPPSKLTRYSPWPRATGHRDHPRSARVDPTSTRGPPARRKPVPPTAARKLGSASTSSSSAASSSDSGPRSRTRPAGARRARAAPRRRARRGARARARRAPGRRSSRRPGRELGAHRRPGARAARGRCWASSANTSSNTQARGCRSRATRARGDSRCSRCAQRLRDGTARAAHARSLRCSPAVRNGCPDSHERGEPLAVRPPAPRRAAACGRRGSARSSSGARRGPPAGAAAASPSAARRAAAARDRAARPRAPPRRRRTARAGEAVGLFERRAPGAGRGGRGLRRRGRLDARDRARRGAHARLPLPSAHVPAVLARSEGAQRGIAGPQQRLPREQAQVHDVPLELRYLEVADAHAALGARARRRAAAGAVAHAAPGVRRCPSRASRGRGMNQRGKPRAHGARTGSRSLPSGRASRSGARTRARSPSAGRSPWGQLALRFEVASGRFSR